MMNLAWKVLVPLVLGLILWQMVAMKLPGGVWVQYPLILLGNLGAIWIVSRVMTSYFKSEQLRTKRAFTPRSLIGTMQVVNTQQAGD